MTKTLVMVLETNDEFSKVKDKLDGPLESITEKSKIYHFSVVDVASIEAYGKTLDLIKENARRNECDAVHIKTVNYNVGLVAVITTIEADLYRKKQ